MTKKTRHPATMRHRDEAAVEAFNDHEVITPKQTLKSFARRVAGPDDMLDMEIIAKAEAAIAELASDFADWMAEETEKLQMARLMAAREGMTPKTRLALFSAAHDLRGGAATFGYPLAGRIAESLCKLFEVGIPLADMPLALIEQHVDAIRAMVRQGVTGGTDATAVTLAEELVRAAESAALTFTGTPPIAPTEQGG